MSDELYRTLHFLAYLPVYLATFIGIGLVLQLRQKHPMACWSAVGAGVSMFLSWTLVWLRYWRGWTWFAEWCSSHGVHSAYAWLAFDVMLSGLQTISVVLLLTALLVGRRQGP